MFDTSRSILQEIDPWFLNNTKKKLFVKRDDLIHSLVSGNKWRKLKYNLSHVQKEKLEGVLTFGGAYSNHLLATAAACHTFGMPSVGIVRGDELSEESNAVLRKCADLGMRFKFISRQEYAEKSERNFTEALHSKFPGFFIIPEGGANYLGTIGCQEILAECSGNYNAVFVSQGTTTTSCGMLLSLRENSNLHVVPALKGFNALGEMKTLLINCAFDEMWIEELLEKIVIHGESHFGGYGKYTNELLEFIRRFNSECNIPLDPVYTGKAMFALMKYCQETAQKEEAILFVHTGGIEGGRSILNPDVK